MAEDAPEAVGSQTLERGLLLLAELARHGPGLTATEAAAATGLHRSIVYRLLVSLERTGFAARLDTGRYRLGPEAEALGHRPGPALRAVAEPVLGWLAQEVDATASLVEAQGGAAVTTLVAEPPTGGPRFSYRLGSRDPLDRGAGGLAAGAAMPPTPGEADRLAGIRRAGYVITHGELTPGAIGAAAPLPGWGLRAAVCLVGADPALATRAIEPLLEAARRIRSALGEERPADIR